MSEIMLNGELFEPCHEPRANMQLFNFVGELAVYNHVFLETDRQGTKMIGGFVWCDEEAYKALLDMVYELEFPVHLNLHEVADSDVAAWREKHAFELTAEAVTLEDLFGDAT